MKTYSVLFVCTGNICRSPTADGVLRKKVDASGLAACVTVDSAGTMDYHVGEPPDDRSQEHARRRGYDISALRARQVQPADAVSAEEIRALVDEVGFDYIARRRHRPAHRGRRFAVGHR